MAGTTNLQINIGANSKPALKEIALFAQRVRTIFATLNARDRTSIGGIPLSQITAQLRQVQQAAVQGQEEMISKGKSLQNQYNNITASIKALNDQMRILQKEAPLAHDNMLRLKQAKYKATVNKKELLLQAMASGQGLEGVNLAKELQSTISSEYGTKRGIVATKDTIAEPYRRAKEEAKQLLAVDTARLKQAVETNKSITGQASIISKSAKDSMAVFEASPEGKQFAAQQAYRQKNEVAYLKLKTEWLEKIKALEARGYKDISIGTKSISSFATGTHGPSIETTSAKMKFAKDTGLLAELQQMQGASNVLIHKQSALKEMMATTANMMKSQISWFAGAGTIFAIAGSIAAAAKATLEFYQNLKNIQAVTGESDEGIRKISAAAIDIAKNTPIAASEASKLGLTLIQAGLNSEQAAEAMKTVSAIVTVSGEDMTTVSKAVTTAMFSWHKSAKDIPDIGNSIAAALNFSRLTVTDLGTAFNYLASTSSIMGRSLNETVSIMATLSNAGIRASTIGTGMSQLFTQLLVPTKNFSAELARMGISANDVNPQMHKFADIVELLQSKGFSAAKAMHLLGDRAGRQMAAAMVMGADSFREMEEKIEKSKQLQEGLAKAMEGPINSIKNLRNQIEVSAIQIGAVGVPAFNLFISLLKTATSVLVAATSGFSFLADTIGGGFTAALTAGAIASVALYRHFTMLAASAMATSGAVSFLSVSLAALAKNPYVIAITATISGLILLGTLFGKNKDKADELAKAKERLAKHNEEVRKSTDAAGESQKSYEAATTRVKEAMEAAKKVDVKFPFMDATESAKAMNAMALYNIHLSVMDSKIKSILQTIADLKEGNVSQELMKGLWASGKTVATYVKDLEDSVKGAESVKRLSEIEGRNALKNSIVANLKDDTAKMTREIMSAAQTPKDLTPEALAKRYYEGIKAQLDTAKKSLQSAYSQFDILSGKPETFVQDGKTKNQLLNEQWGILVRLNGEYTNLKDAEKAWASEVDLSSKDSGKGAEKEDNQYFGNLHVKLLEGLKEWDEFQRKKRADALEANAAIIAANEEMWERDKKGLDAIIEAQKKAREMEISLRLTQIDYLEKQHTISPLSATESRIALEKESLAIKLEEQSEINTLTEEGKLLWLEQQAVIEQINGKLVELQQTYREWTGTGMAGFKYGLQEYMWNPSYTMFNQMRGLATETANAMSQSFETFFFDAFEGRLKSFQDYFLSFLKAIQQALAKVLAQQVAMGMISGVMGLFRGGASPAVSNTPSGGGYSLTGLNTLQVANAKGNIFSGSGISTYSNQIVNRPTIFPFAKGIGLMGEAGSEAIMPLRRTKSGNLGVEASVAQPNINVAINIENQTSQPVSAKTGGMQFDGEKYVIGVVLKNLENNPSFRNAFAQ